MTQSVGSGFLALEFCLMIIVLYRLRIALRVEVREIEGRVLFIYSVN